MFSFLCFPFSAFSSETTFQGYPHTNGIKITLLKCSEVGQGWCWGLQEVGGVMGSDGKLSPKIIGIRCFCHCSVWLSSCVILLVALCLSSVSSPIWWIQRTQRPNAPLRIMVAASAKFWIFVLEKFIGTVEKGREEERRVVKHILLFLIFFSGRES